MRCRALTDCVDLLVACGLRESVALGASTVLLQCTVGSEAADEKNWIYIPGGNGTVSMPDAVLQYAQYVSPHSVIAQTVRGECAIDEVSKQDIRPRAPTILSTHAQNRA